MTLPKSLPFGRPVVALFCVVAGCAAESASSVSQDTAVIPQDAPALVEDAPDDDAEVASPDASGVEAEDAVPSSDTAPAPDTEPAPDGEDVAATPGPNACVAQGTPAATAACLAPTRQPEYYVAQAEAYFDTLDIAADPLNVPAYGEWVIRWEWPPWLRLTGYGRQVLLDTAAILRQFDPSTVPVRDCRYFPVQPFARCVVQFQYEGGPCPIYEEFIFNDDGEMTFIEAWSDLPTLRPISPADPWGEAADFPRLGNRVPGLGYGDGHVDLEAAAVKEAAKTDPDVAALVERAKDFWDTWLAELNAANETNFFAIGCGW